MVSATSLFIIFLVTFIRIHFKIVFQKSLNGEEPLVLCKFSRTFICAFQILSCHKIIDMQQQQRRIHSKVCSLFLESVHIFLVRPSSQIIHKLIRQFWFYQAISNTLKMRMKSVLETSKNFHILTRLTAREYFIAVTQVYNKQDNNKNFQYARKYDLNNKFLI